MQLGVYSQLAALLADLLDVADLQMLASPLVLWQVVDTIQSYAWSKSISDEGNGMAFLAAFGFTYWLTFDTRAKPLWCKARR